MSLTNFNYKVKWGGTLFSNYKKVEIISYKPNNMSDDNIISDDHVVVFVRTDLNDIFYSDLIEHTDNDINLELVLSLLKGWICRG